MTEPFSGPPVRSFLVLWRFPLDDNVIHLLKDFHELPIAGMLHEWPQFFTSLCSHTLCQVTSQLLPLRKYFYALNLGLTIGFALSNQMRWR